MERITTVNIPDELVDAYDDIDKFIDTLKHLNTKLIWSTNSPSFIEFVRAAENIVKEGLDYFARYANVTDDEMNEWVRKYGDSIYVDTDSKKEAVSHMDFNFLDKFGEYEDAFMMFVHGAQWVNSAFMVVSPICFVDDNSHGQPFPYGTGQWKLSDDAE